MNRKNFKYAFLALLAAGLSSCASEDFWDTFDRTIDGPIDFTVGVETSPAQRNITRATDEYSMVNGTQVRLKVDGIWKKISETDPVSQKTTCTTDAEKMSFTETETLYWDDYGAGDPDNATYTSSGLSVLGVAVDGMNTAPIVGDNEWESLSWSVITDGKDVLNGDIIVSNNLTAYKFSERSSTGKMVFTHPLSKITFNIKAGQGFPSTGVGATNTKFTKDPRLILTKATSLADTVKEENNYALASGTVSIKNGTAESDGNKAKVVAGTTGTTDANITVIKQAIVYPGTQLGASDNDVIAVLQADDNVYYIKAAEIRNKMKKLDSSTDYKTKAGYNYIINITVNKTGIRTTATVTDWNVVNAAEAYPVINVDTELGAGTTAPKGFNSYAFWRSEKIDIDYQHEATPTVNIDGSTDFGASTLYWTHHNQHYHFRGIYPLYNESTMEGPKVEEVGGVQVVKVKNGEYSASTFPSNFMIGMPELAKGTMCNNLDHDSKDMSIYGICARTSAINLNFRYMLSQVEVNLTSSESTADNYVNLSNVVVEFVNVYNSGNILLKDRSAEVTGSADKFTLPLVDAENHKYLGIIVPQDLTYTTAGNASNVRIKITVTNGDSTKDIYYADMAPILKSGTSVKIAPNGKWESGVHYVYNLKITKTEIKATATLTDWTTVEAAEDVWF